MKNTVEITALARVTSRGSGGRAAILACAGREMIATDQLTNSKFAKYAVGTNVIVHISFDVVTRVRRIISVDTAYVETVDAFELAFADEIAQQNAAIMDKLAAASIKTGMEPAAKPAVAAASGWTDSFFVQDEERNAFSMAKALAAEVPAKVMIIGASGYGKTSLPKAFAKQHGMKYVRFNVALVRDPEEFFGWRTVENGDVKFIPSEFTKAIQEGNCVVVLDELNRATPEMANALFPILDDDARTVVFGQEIAVAKDVIIVATINVGYQFVGTFLVDQALLNRMDITLRVAPLPQKVEQEILQRRTGVTAERATAIVAVCNRLRDLVNGGKIVADASTRTSIRVAKFVALGASLQDAFAWAIVNSADIEERKEIIDAISSVI